jgi:tetratricopeptide (TPR) repeat protein
LAYGFLTPLMPEERALMADIYLMLNIPDKAVKFYEILLKDSLEPKILKKLVHGYIRLYDYETAISWIDKVSKNKNFPDFLMLKANLLFETDRFREAALLFNRMSQEGKKRGRAFLMLGYAQWNCGRIYQAKKAFKKAKTYKKQKKDAQKALHQLEFIRY